MFLSEFFSDMAVYMRYSGVSPMQDETKRRYYKILIEAHALEKGLSLQNPRALFGRDKIDFLMREVKRYDTSFSVFPVEMVIGAFETYIKMHKDLGVANEMLDDMEKFCSEQLAAFELTTSGGLRHFETAYKKSDMTPASFLTSRFSNRAMSKEKLGVDAICEVVKIAQAAPSQCNRQASQVHFFQDQAQIDELLQLQGGANGFSQDVGNLFVISCDLSAWGGAQQRNQVFVDGSLFSMALIYALHAAGIAACPLNLAVRSKKEKTIKRVAGIPQDQRLIMMIAAGKALGQGGYKAAASPRRPSEEVLHIHSPAVEITTGPAT
ncbi:nitroreductase family protein [Alphaproteobacteria bacterium KMM 3653]|uniref:Nitroreductase family protein n=1 Tax=Harenicola maris TaxID=2841044 RepID=A0AAP2CQH4_9RHOB|nr:nitroreductase family protein [Harenicola maris]